MDSEKYKSESILKINLQLGDIIQILSPSNNDLHEKIYFIKFINDNKIELLNQEKTITLNIVDGKFLEESIENILLLDRQDSNSFVIQNNIKIENYISVYFGDPLPQVLNGIITNIEEDMIEITLNSTNEIIYIDFAYSGIPEQLNIEKIVIKENLDEIKEKDLEIGEKLDIDIAKDGDDPENYKSHIVEDENDYELIKHTDENVLNEIFLDTIEFEDDYEEFYHSVNVSDDEKRYTLDVQLNNYMDTMIGEYKSNEINEDIMNKINLEILRYKQLREFFSDFDANNNPTIPKGKTEFYKPLKEILFNFNKKIPWIIPVVSYSKNFVYENNDEAGVEDDYINKEKMGEFIEKLNKTVNSWSKNTSKDVIQEYKNYINTLLSLYDNTTVNENPIYNVKSMSNKKNIAKAHIDIINNAFGDFYSYSVKKEEIQNTRFLMEVCNDGLEMLKTEYVNNKKHYKLTELTPADKLIIDSFITLPFPTYELFKMNSDYSNIYEKSNLNNATFLYNILLNDKTIVNNFILDEISIPKILNTHNTINDNNLFNSINNFSIDDSIDVSSDEKYNLLLESFIPTTKNIIMYLSKTKLYLNYKSLIKDTYGANIDTHNLNVEDTKLIQSIFQKNIDEYKKNYKMNKDLLNELILLLNKEIISDRSDNVLDFNVLKKELKDELFEIYDIDVNIFNSTSEILNYFTKVDNNKFFMSALNKNIMDLIVGNLLDNFVKQNKSNEKEKEDEKDAEKRKLQETCDKYYLSKKYSSLEELEEDNNKTIYFDSIYDNTVYSLINEYENEKTSLDSTQFFEFLTKKLMEIMNLTKKNALREARAIINEKREIIDDDYALLINKTDNKNYIYIRKDNVWIIDDKFKADFYIDSNKIFCDSNKECLSIDDKCVSGESIKKQRLKEDVDKILDNFKEKYNLSVEEIQGQINNNYENAKLYVKRILNINYYRVREINEKLIKYNSEIDNTGQLESPYEMLKDTILGIPDIIKRYNLVKKFCLKFTREAINDENTYWLYCIKTSIKLIPSFLLRLANSFINKQNYIMELDSICAEQGTISDDNNYWVDKHSGYIIKKIEFNTDEGYDDKGYKLNTKELLEEEYVFNINHVNKFSTPDIKTIMSIVKSMGQMMGINLDGHSEYIIKNVTTIQKTNIPSEEDYNKLLLKHSKKEGKVKALPSYSDVYNSSLILLTLTYISISIQISIPSIKTKKTFPGCIKSFSGYPIEGDQDKTAIIYIACVANKIKSSIKPWNSLLKMSESTIAKKIEALMEQYVLNDKDNIELINKKREYLTHNKNEFIPDELSINLWQTFMPPLIDIKISKENITPMSDTLDKEIFELYSKGKKNNYLETIVSKIIYLSNSIIQSIQLNVRKHSALLENNAGEPFLENACCNSGLNAIDFFIKLDKTILDNNTLANYYDNLIQKIKKITSPSILYDDRNTKVLLPKIKKEFNEDIIYKAFIYYCNFNNDIPIDDELRSVCMDKPIGFTSGLINDDIENLKYQGKNYTKNSLNDLLDIINKRNLITINTYNDSISNTEQIRDIVNLYLDSENIDKLLFEKLSLLLDTFDITKSSNKTELDDVKNHLLRSNIIMKKNILEFIKKQRNISKTFYTTFEKFLEVNINEKDTKFHKDYINNLVNIFPNIILNKSINYNSIPEHWKLTDLHNKDISSFIEKYYNKLMVMSNGPEIESAFRLIKQKNDVLIKLLNLSFYNRPINVSNSDKKITITSIFDMKYIEYYYTYVYYSIINDYITISENREFQMEILNIEDFDVNDFNNKLLTYLFNFFTILNDHKNLISNGYKKIKEKISFAKEKEKDLITDYLKHLTDDEREIENMFKSNKLEKWSKGLQKSLTQYVGESYDEERLEIEKQMIKEKKLNINDNVTEMNKELYKLDLDEEEKITQEIDDEEFNMSNVPDDDDYDSDYEYD